MMCKLYYPTDIRFDQKELKLEHISQDKSN